MRISEKLKHTKKAPILANRRFNRSHYSNKVIKKAYSISPTEKQYIYFDDMNKMLAFLSTCEPIDVRSNSEIFYNTVEKLTKNLIVTTSNIRFKHVIKDNNRLKELIKKHANIETVYCGDIPIYYHVVIPSYASACLDIKTSGFTQDIYFDIQQAIACKIWEMISGKTVKNGVIIRTNKECRLVIDKTEKKYTSRFVFGEYTTKKGTTKSCINKLFSVIESVLYLYSNHSQSNNGVLVSLDSYEKAVSPYLDGDSKQTPQNLSAYMRAIVKYNQFSHDNCLNRSDIQAFFKMCENDYTRKHIDKMKLVLNCQFNGMTIAQTHIYAKQNDVVLSESAIGKIRIELKELWIKYGCKVDIYTHNYDNGIVTSYTPQNSCGKCLDNIQNHVYAIDNKSNYHSVKVANFATLESGYNTNKLALSTYAYNTLENEKALKKSLVHNELVNQNSDYAQYAIEKGQKEYNFRQAINEYCKNERIQANEKEFIPTSYNVKVVKTNSGVNTYYDNKLIRSYNYHK